MGQFRYGPFPQSKDIEDEFQPLFIVFPAPLGFASVYRAHFSSLIRFCSALSSASNVPSCSAASSRSSDSVGASADACLIRPIQFETGYPKYMAHPPPVRIFPCRASSSKYSSMVIVGSLCELLKTSLLNLSLCDRFPVLGRIVNGRSTLPPPEIN